MPATATPAPAGPRRVGGGRRGRVHEDAAARRARARAGRQSRDKREASKGAGREGGGARPRARTGGELAVGVVGREAEQALAHVHQALRHAHQQQQRGLLRVVAAQPAQHARQPRVVGARADDACAPRPARELARSLCEARRGR